MHTKNKKVRKTISTFKERLLLKFLIIAKNTENIITKQGWQSHRIDDFLRYLLRRKTAMRFCDAMQSRITYTTFFAII